MKKNIQDSQIIEKIKNAKVKPSKDFKKNLFNSLEKEYTGEAKKFFWQNFRFLNIIIMNFKKILAGTLVTVSSVGFIGAFNTSYADEKNNVIDYLGSGFEMIISGVDHINILNDKEFMKLSGLTEKQLMKIKEDTQKIIQGIKVYDENNAILIESGDGFMLNDIEANFGKDNLEFKKLSDREIKKMVESGKLVEVSNEKINELIRKGEGFSTLELEGEKSRIPLSNKEIDELIKNGDLK